MFMLGPDASQAAGAVISQDGLWQDVGSPSALDGRALNLSGDIEQH